MDHRRILGGDFLQLGKISTILQNYLGRYLYRPPTLFHSLFEERKFFEQASPRIPDKIRQQFAGKLNPFNLCPRSIIYWFLVPPYSAIGLAVLGLHQVVVYWRQQIEPNDTVYVTFQILDLKTPFPLTLFVMFASIGLVITGSSYSIYETVNALCTEKIKKIEDAIDDFPASIIDSEQSITKLLDPFKLTPKMSIYFPVYDNHTSIGFLNLDFRHAELSIKQSLEPNETVLSLIRFLDLYAPFPLMVAAMLLSVGLFITEMVYEYRPEMR